MRLQRGLDFWSLYDFVNSSVVVCSVFRPLLSTFFSLFHNVRAKNYSHSFIRISYPTLSLIWIILQYITTITVNISWTRHISLDHHPIFPTISLDLIWKLRIVIFVLSKLLTTLQKMSAIINQSPIRFDFTLFFWNEINNLESTKINSPN